jgi:hypothetical protein
MPAYEAANHGIERVLSAQPGIVLSAMPCPVSLTVG